MSTSAERPTGTVTFLFTDIEGSTRLLKQLRDDYATALADHQRIVRDALAAHDGWEIDTQGDSFFAAFRRAKDAVGAAVDAQRALAAHEWPGGSELRVRMGMHTGEPAVGGDRYVGLGVHRAARIAAAGHGGQVLVSQTTRELLRDDPPPDVTLRDLGEHELKDMDEPERIYQLVAPSLETDFPALKTSAPAPFEGQEGALIEAAEDAVEEMRSPWRRNRRLLVGGAAAALVVVAAVLAVVLTRGGTADASREVAPNDVGLIDAKSGKISAQISVGNAPADVAAATDAVWVTNADENSVSRIDPKTNDVRQTIAVGNGPSGIAVGAGAVWVANGLDGTLSRIDPGTDRVVQTITVGNGPTGVAYGGGAVWIANAADGTVSRVDSQTGRVVRTIPAANGVSGIAFGSGRLWVVAPASGTVLSLDPKKGDVLDQIGVGVDPDAVATGAGSVWIANRSDGTVSRIDPRARAVTDTISVGRDPGALAFGQDAVWVANGGSGTLSKIDPASARVVKTVRLSNSPRGLAVTPAGSTSRCGRPGRAIVEGLSASSPVMGWISSIPRSRTRRSAGRFCRPRMTASSDSGGPVESKASSSCPTLPYRSRWRPTAVRRTRSDSAETFATRTARSWSRRTFAARSSASTRSSHRFPRDPVLQGHHRRREVRRARL